MDFLCALMLTAQTNIVTLSFFLPNHTHLHHARRHDRKDEVEPDVGEDAPEGGDEEHPEVFDLAGLAFGDRPHADPNDHKHVEGGAADDGSWSQLTSLEVVTAHLKRLCVCVCDVVVGGEGGDRLR